MNLTAIQYDAIMQAINNAKAEIADGTFIDVYAEMPAGYTDETLLQALNDVENKIISDNIPS